LPHNDFVDVSVYDQFGRKVKDLVHEIKDAGTYQTTFDASGLPSGIYWYRLTAGSQTLTRQAVIIK
jgi:hypothetical protein